MRFIHIRRYDNKDRLLPKGGKTIGWVIQDGVLYYTVVGCDSRDHYSREKGRQVAIERMAAGLNSEIPAAKIVEAMLKELQATHVLHDYSYPGLSIENIPYSFINYYLANET